MRDLGELLREAAEPGPTEGLDLGGVVERGRLRVRRRRVGTVLGSGAAMAAVVAGAVLASGVGIGDRVVPAGPVEPIGPVVSFADAQPAIRDADYTVLTTLTNENLDRENGVQLQGVTPDGKIVVEDGPRGERWEYRLGLLDPRTGDMDWLTEPASGIGGNDPGRFVGASARRVVWAGTSAKGDVELVSIDRATRRRSVLEIGPDLIGVDREHLGPVGPGVLGPDDRVYFSVLGEDIERATLWSVPLDSAAGLRREGTVGTFDVDGDLLTYTEHANRPSSIIHVRNLRTGEETSFDARSGSRCNALGLEREGDVIAVQQYCGERDGSRDDRLQLVTGSGEPIVTFRDHGLNGGALTSRYVTLQGDYDDTAGSYVYDLRSRRLLRVSDQGVKFGPTLYGRDDLLTWATPVNRRHGMKLWAVAFHPR